MVTVEEPEGILGLGLSQRESLSRQYHSLPVLTAWDAGFTEPREYLGGVDSLTAE